MSQVKYYACQHLHVFTWGDEDWHKEASGYGGAPTHCIANWSDCEYAREYYMVGDTCLDSSILCEGDSPEAAILHAKTARRLLNYNSAIDPLQRF